MTCAWAPSGRELATGSYDRTIRIYAQNENVARDIYHTKRMQRIWSLQYTLDHKFIVSGSDDGNVRVWKAVSNQQLGQVTTREQAAHDYRNALVRRYQHVPEVRKISRARRIPKAIKNQTKQALAHKESQQRKQANRVKYSKDGKFVAERDKAVVREEE